MHRYIIILLLLLSTQSCDNDGYHFLGRYSNRQTAEQKALEELIDGYNDLDNGYHKILYQFPEKKTEVKYAVWYDKNSQQLGIENDIHSGMCCTWKNVDKSVLRALVVEKKGIQKARLSPSVIHPTVGDCPY